MTATKVETTRRFADLAEVFSPGSTVKAGEQTWAYKRTDDTVTPFMSRVPPPVEETDIKVDTRNAQLNKEFVVRFTVKTQSYFPFLDILDQVKAVIPNTDTAIGNFSKYAEALVQVVRAATPTMDADITVHFFRTETGVECSVTGTHDQFPSLELWVNGKGIVKREAQNDSVYMLLTAGGQSNPLRSQQEPLQVGRG